MMQKLKQRAAALTAVTGSALVVGQANAALPAGIESGFTSITTDALALADLVWPVVLAVFGALILFKLFKRFGSKI